MVKSTLFNFTNKYLRAFEELKSRIVNAPVLAYYDPKKASQIETNASDGVIARVFL